MNKEYVVYIYIHIHIHNNGILFSHKKEKNLPLVTTWIGPEGIKLSEISQTQKDKYCIISLTHIIEKSQSHRNRE